MSIGLLGVLVVLGLNLVLVVTLTVRPAWLRVAGGRLLGVLGLFVLPAVGFALGYGQHTERAKQTEFCVSCHVMEPYGDSLLMDSADHLPAVHFQNAQIDREHACYVCHTSYTMFGDLQAKLNGVQHLWVNYVSGAPEPLRLYRPYENRECFFCHADARSFEESDFHLDIREDLDRGDISCLECHALSHDVAELSSYDTWEAGR